MVIGLHTCKYIYFEERWLKKEKIVISLWIKELKDKHGSNVADKIYVETFLRETWLKIIFVSSSLVNQFLVLRINTFHIVNWLKFNF